MRTFEDFWKAYPRHIAKKDARKAWDHLNPQNGQSEAIVDAVEQQKLHQWQGKDVQFIPYPATWLRGERWEDELESNESREQAKVRRNIEAARSALSQMHGGAGDGFGSGDHERTGHVISATAERFKRLAN